MSTTGEGTHRWWLFVIAAALVAVAIVAGVGQWRNHQAHARVVAAQAAKDQRIKARCDEVADAKWRKSANAPWYAQAPHDDLTWIRSSVDCMVDAGWQRP